MSSTHCALPSIERSRGGAHSHAQPSVPSRINLAKIGGGAHGLQAVEPTGRLPRNKVAHYGKFQARIIFYIFIIAFRFRFFYARAIIVF